MGAGASTLTEDKVKDIVNEEVDLSSYAKAADYKKTTELKGYLDPLYLDESDKADPTSTEMNNETKWVTPRYVQTKMATGNVDAREVARNLATISDFQPVITTALRDNSTFQSGVARNLATVGAFQTAMWTNISGESGVTFRGDLVARMANDTRFRGPKGDAGPAGTFNNDAIKANLWDGTGDGEGNKVMWCADGELCKVPVGKGGIQFTGSNQVISGFGTGTNTKIVKVDDHLYLKPGSEINFIRDGIKETSTNTNISGSYGPEDGRIKVRETIGTTDDAYKSAELEIVGIGKKLNGGTRIPRKIKMYDDVEINGKLKVNNAIDKSLTIRAPEDAYKSGEASLEFKNSWINNDYTLGRVQGVDIGTSPNTFSGRLKFDVGFNTGYRNLMSMDHTGIDMHPTGYGNTVLRLRNNTDKTVDLYYNSDSRADNGGQNVATLRNNGGSLRLMSNGSASITIDGDSITLDGNVNIRYPSRIPIKLWKTTGDGQDINGHQYFEFYNRLGGRSHQLGFDGNSNFFYN